MKISSFKPIHELMSENELVAPMLTRLNLIAHYQKIYLDALPANLKKNSRVAAIEETTLVVAAANGAIAAMLKQMLPRLLVKFRENQKQDQKVTAIRVLVQPDILYAVRAPSPSAEGVKGESMPLTALAQLTDRLGDSPLKTTLQKIRKRRERESRQKRG